MKNYRVSTALTCVVAVLLLTACAAPQKFSWVKPGVSQQDADSALARCEFQVRMAGKTVAERQELTSLCMRGEGFRWVPVR